MACWGSVMRLLSLRTVASMCPPEPRAGRVAAGWWFRTWRARPPNPVSSVTLGAACPGIHPDGREPRIAPWRMISRPGSRAAKPDARVAGAAAHWGYRFTSNGTDYGDFTATLARITRWADWCREWGVTATHYEQLAEAARTPGSRQTADGRLAARRAGLALGQVRLRRRPGTAAGRARAERRLLLPGRPRAHPAGRTGAHPLRRHDPGRLPPRPAAGGFDNRPGRDHGPRPRLHQGGAAGDRRVLPRPRAGHARHRRPRARASPSTSCPSSPPTRRWPPRRSTTCKTARARPGPDRPVRREPRRLLRRPRGRLREAAEGGRRAGRARTVSTWTGTTCPPQTRATFQARSGAKSDAEARAKAAELTLEEAAAHIDTPLLVVGGGRDAIVPAYHQERLAAEVKSAELAPLPGRQPRRHQPRL